MPELLIVIVIIGILAAIAVPLWRGVVESRQVDSAANQLASDLRLANSRATNRLVEYQVILADGSSSYQLGPAGSTTTRTLPDGVKITTGLSTIKFNPDGSASGSTGAANEIVVSKTSPPSDPKHGISVVPATSRVRVD